MAEEYKQFLKPELIDADFTNEEHNMMSVAFRNYVGQLQSGIRIISVITKTKKYKKYGDNIFRFKIKQQLKIKQQSLDIINILMKTWKLCTEPKSQAYHQKMIGDFYRYAYEACEIEQYPVYEEPSKEQEVKIVDETNPAQTTLTIEEIEDDIDNAEKYQLFKEPLISNEELK